MGKHRHRKHNYTPCLRGVVKYGEDKFVVLIVLIFVTIPFIMALFQGEYMGFLVSFCICVLPMSIFTLFNFRFCVKYDARERKIEYRRFFRFRIIDFNDIERIYKKSDTKTVFLIIKAKGHKVGINMRSCKGAGELQFLLKSRLPKKCEY
ncbi:MAG: hypothetical protein K2K91_10105 [Ruminococcus sp.]|nr:hypothetical protein [Ruminococcus sp.]